MGSSARCARVLNGVAAPGPTICRLLFERGDGVWWSGRAIDARHGSVRSFLPYAPG